MVSFSAIRAYGIYQNDPIVRRIDFDDPDPPVIEAPPPELIRRTTPQWYNKLQIRITAFKTSQSKSKPAAEVVDLTASPPKTVIDLTDSPPKPPLKLKSVAITKPVKCDLCFLVCSGPLQFRQHRDSKTCRKRLRNKASYLCVGCNNRFKNHNSLVKHRKKHNH